MNIRRIGRACIAALALFTTLAPLRSNAQVTPPDVLVVGGTPAGVAAAVAAARRGQNVELITRRAELGGILTDGMMDQWDLNLSRDGVPVQGGIFTEIYARLGDSFTPLQAARTFADLVAREPRIRVIADAAPVGAEVVTASDTRTVTGVTFRSTDGRGSFVVRASYVIDATDNGDVAALAGARYDVGRQDTGRDERCQPVTLMFTVTRVDWPRLQAAYDPARDGFGGAAERRAWGYAKLLRRYRTGAADAIVSDLNLGHENGGNVTLNALDILGVDGRSDAALQHARSVTQREAPRLVAWLRGEIPGFEHAQVGRYADAVYVRETRHFAGVERLTANAIWDGSVPYDSIALSSYPIDLHPLTVGERPAFAPIRHVYGVPFGSLVPRGFTNVIVASPAISASHLASGSARVIPTTIEEGEAAGAATALAAADRVSFPAIVRDREAIEDLRTDLVRSGVILKQRSVASARAATG